MTYNRTNPGALAGAAGAREAINAVEAGDIENRRTRGAEQAPCTVAVIRKNSREELRITLEDFKGHRLISFRVWYEAEDGDMRPGKQGLALRLGLLPELRAALVAAESRI